MFAASENNVPVVKSAEIEADLKQEYIKKLDIDGYGIPDPFSLEEGWLEEEEGRYLWPMVLSTDIFLFLMFHPSELKSDDFSDLKLVKLTVTTVMAGLCPFNFIIYPSTIRTVSYVGNAESHKK